MEQNLQEFNTNQKLLEWSQRVTECRESGMTVKDWCKANGIAVSTYYKQQRAVFEAAKNMSGETKSTVEFTEIRFPKPERSRTPAVTIRIGEAEADIYAGADEEMIRTICQVLKSC